jgi:hypothetical protein
LIQVHEGRTALGVARAGGISKRHSKEFIDVDAAMKFLERHWGTKNSSKMWVLYEVAEVSAKLARLVQEAREFRRIQVRFERQMHKLDMEPLHVLRVHVQFNGEEFAYSTSTQQWTLERGARQQGAHPTVYSFSYERAVDEVYSDVEARLTRLAVSEEAASEVANALDVAATELGRLLTESGIRGAPPTIRRLPATAVTSAAAVLRLPPVTPDEMRALMVAVRFEGPGALLDRSSSKSAHASTWSKRITAAGAQRRRPTRRGKGRGTAGKNL